MEIRIRNVPTNSIALATTRNSKWMQWIFDVHMSVYRKYISKVQPTRCNVFTIYLFLEITLHVSGGSSAYHQEHKTVHTASGIVKPILLPAAISSTIAAGSSIGLTIPDAVCTVLCSWWWAVEPPETCRAIYRNKYTEKTLHLVGCTLEI